MNSTGFFGGAMPATFARRASLRLRMTTFFDAMAPHVSALSFALRAATFPGP